MTEQSNERIEADNALRSIIRNADNRIDADAYDRGMLAGQMVVVQVYFDHDPALLKQVQQALDRLRERSRKNG